MKRGERAEARRECPGIITTLQAKAAQSDLCIYSEIFLRVSFPLRAWMNSNEVGCDDPSPPFSSGATSSAKGHRRSTGVSLYASWANSRFAWPRVRESGISLFEARGKNPVRLLPKPRFQSLARDFANSIGTP